MADMSANNERPNERPAWLAPVVVVVIVLALVGASTKSKDAVENPLVDFAILTVGVFAFAWMFRFIAVKLGSPGMARFFGASQSDDVK